MSRDSGLVTESSEREHIGVRSLYKVRKHPGNSICGPGNLKALVPALRRLSSFRKSSLYPMVYSRQREHLGSCRRSWIPPRHFLADHYRPRAVHLKAPGNQNSKKFEQSPLRRPPSLSSPRREYLLFVDYCPWPFIIFRGFCAG